MKINVLALTQEAKRVAFTAIRTCYSPNEPCDIYAEEFDQYEQRRIVDTTTENSVTYIPDSDRLLRQIANSGHTSTLEHITFTFAIAGITRACLAQLTRHRIASYSVQSQRYVKQSSDSKHGQFEYTTPNFDSCSAPETAQKIYDEAMEAAQYAYDQLISYGVKAEDARDVLPQSSHTNLVLTMNLRSILNFYKLRNKDTHAQSEIAELAEHIKNAVVAYEPWTQYFFDNGIK